MGNSFFCERCDIKKYNLSRTCTDENLSGKFSTTRESDKKCFLEGKQLSVEEHWRLKLKCLDDVHSQINDLTQEAFDELIKNLEKRLQVDSTFYCKNRDLVCPLQHELL